MRVCVCVCVCVYKCVCINIHINVLLHDVTRTAAKLNTAMYTLYVMLYTL